MQALKQVPWYFPGTQSCLPWVDLIWVLGCLAINPSWEPFGKVAVVEYYALMYGNGKMRPVETIPGMRG
jgi:hypothetical protein